MVCQGCTEVLGERQDPAAGGGNGVRQQTPQIERTRSGWEDRTARLRSLRSGTVWRDRSRVIFKLVQFFVSVGNWLRIPDFFRSRYCSELPFR